MSDIEYGWAEAWNTLDAWDYDLFNYPFEPVDDDDGDEGSRNTRYFCGA